MIFNIKFYFNIKILILNFLINKIYFNNFDYLIFIIF
jgi:hypothetical protein